MDATGGPITVVGVLTRSRRRFRCRAAEGSVSAGANCVGTIESCSIEITTISVSRMQPFRDELPTDSFAVAEIDSAGSNADGTTTGDDVVAVYPANYTNIYSGTISIARIGKPLVVTLTSVRSVETRPHTAGTSNVKRRLGEVSRGNPSPWRCVTRTGSRATGRW